MTNKIYGTTIYIGEINIDTIFGNFVVYTFQDLINKGYILALCYGNIKEKELYSRIHSSCVTSETLQSLDCDCVDQLNGALKKIYENNNGILFYLIQEGRGCGYVGKSRSCMHVQYHNDEISTFDAYSQLGMKKDYRSYSNIWDIYNLLNLNCEFILLTNNPDKINGLKELGIRIKKVESIEIPPNPFNHKYLISKQQTGHLIYSAKEKIKNYNQPYQAIKPFKPYHIEKCIRFIHVSSYYIPVKPFNNIILVNNDIYQKNIELFESNKIDNIKNNKVLIYLNEDQLKNLPDELLFHPYWMKVNVYYDIASNLDYVVLEYGDCKNNIPIVRIHSESILNRFPLKNKKYTEMYKISINMIIRNGCGIIVLFYNDGKGSGFGNYVLQNSTNDKNSIGIKNDQRDYDAAAKILKTHLSDDSNNITLIYTCNSNRELSRLQIENNNINIHKYVYIDLDKQSGYESLYNRIQNCFNFQQIYEKINILDLISSNYNVNNISNFNFINLLKNNIDHNYNFIVSGIGTSESHAKYLVNLFNNDHIKFKSILEVRESKFIPETTKLILFSQGLSNNTIPCLELFDYKNIILFTSVTISSNSFDNNNKVMSPNKTKYSKSDILKKLLDNNCFIIQFPQENEYETLIRITGPLAGYLAVFKFYNIINSNNIKIPYYQELSRYNIFNPDEKFIKNLIDNRRICIIFPNPIDIYSQNIRNKFVEGIFINPLICNYMEFVHGFYQNIEYNNKQMNKKYSIILINTSNSDKNSNTELYVNKSKELLKDYPVWEIKTSILKDLEIVEIELRINFLVLQLIERLNINQVNWDGKDKQHIMYDL